MEIDFFNILTYGEVGNCHVSGMKFDMSTIVLKISYIPGNICRYMANSIAEVTLIWCQSSSLLSNVDLEVIMNLGSLRPLVAFIDNNFKISCHFYLFICMFIQYLLMYIYIYSQTHTHTIYTVHILWIQYMCAHSHTDIHVYSMCVCVYAHTYWRTEINLGYCSQVPFSLLSETQIFTGLTSLSQPLTPSMTVVSRGMGSQYFLSPLTASLVKDIMNFKLLTAFIKTCLVPPCQGESQISVEPKSCGSVVGMTPHCGSVPGPGIFMPSCSHRTVSVVCIQGYIAKSSQACEYSFYCCHLIDICSFTQSLISLCVW